MSSQKITDFKLHFLTDKQFNDKPSPSANELWFVNLPHWLNYNKSTCLGIITQPTCSGNEINIYAGSVFVIHKGKNPDGTLKNQIVSIDTDTYFTVNSSGGYCFDENGTVHTGTITYNASTNKVSVDGVEGNYTNKIQSYTYSDGIVTLNEDISIASIGGGGATFTSSGDNWSFDFGSSVMQGGKNFFNYGESYSYITFPTPMSNTDYVVQISSSSYYQINVYSKTTTGVTLYIEYSYETVNYAWQVMGSK